MDETLKQELNNRGIVVEAEDVRSKLGYVLFKLGPDDVTVMVSRVLMEDYPVGAVADQIEQLYTMERRQ